MTISSTIKTGFDRATTRVGSTLEDTASKLRERDPALEVAAALDEAKNTVDHVVDGATERVVDARVSQRAAQSLASMGSYLREADFDQLTADLSELVRTHPGKAVAFAAGAGLIAGATLGRGTVLRFVVPTFIQPVLTRAWNAVAASGGAALQPLH